MSRKIDRASGLIYTIKRPGENKTYGVNFKNIMPTGETISTINTVAIVKTGLVTEVTVLASGAMAASGAVANIKLSAGTDGEDYEMTVNVTDSSGSIHEDDVMIKVRKAGTV